jgi:hypothetical protein
MLPLVRRHLEETGWPGVPDPVRREIVDRHEGNRRRNRILTIEHLALIDRLRHAGIEAVSFKGSVTAQICYGDPAARPYGDIDLLVAPADVRGAIEVMTRAGYEPLIPLSATQRASFLRHRTEYPLQRPGRGGVVDLHWEIFHRQFCFPLVPDPVRMREVRVEGQPLRTLGPEDQLLMLSAHATKHLWPRIEWVAAIAWLLRASPDVDLECARSRAAEIGGRRILALGLALADWLATGGVAREAAAWDAPTTALRDEVTGRWTTDAPPPTHWLRWYLRSRERRRDRAAILLRTAIVPTIGDWRSVDLPSGLSALHYALRPVRLLRRGLRTLASGGPP